MVLIECNDIVRSVVKRLLIDPMCEWDLSTRSLGLIYAQFRSTEELAWLPTVLVLCVLR